jgi:hypothetical protein
MATMDCKRDNCTIFSLVCSPMLQASFRDPKNFTDVTRDVVVFKPECTLLQVFTDMFVDHSFCTDSDRIPSMADGIFQIHSRGILNKKNKSDKDFRNRCNDQLCTFGKSEMVNFHIDPGR